jgi:Spy/CpxP family protein refolding chaperone
MKASENKAMLRLWFISILLTMSLAGATGSAARSRPLDAMGKWWQSPELASELGLTAGERQRLDDLYMDLLRRSLDLRTSVKKARIELDALVEKPELDEKAALEKIKSLEKSRAQLTGIRYRFLVEARKILGSDRFIRLKFLYREYIHHNSARRKKFNR